MAEGLAWAINADAGSPAYAAQIARRILSALQMQGQADRVGAREGIRPGSQAITLSSTTVTVHRHVGFAYPGLTAASGPYPYEMSEGTHTLDPADATNDRIDAIDIQVQDDDEDASGFRRIRSVYVVGTPGAPPAEPALTANAFRAATAYVPADGTGSPTLTYVAPFAVTNGAILPVRDTTELPSAGLYDGLRAWQQDEQFDLVRIGAGWENVRHEEVRASNVNAAATGMVASEASVLAVDLTIPAHWNGWDVQWDYTFQVRDAGAAAQNRSFSLRVRHGSLSGTLLSAVYEHELNPAPGDDYVIAVSGGETGLSGTGTQTIRLTGVLGALDDYEVLNRDGFLRAVRTS